MAIKVNRIKKTIRDQVNLSLSQALHSIFVANSKWPLQKATAARPAKHYKESCATHPCAIYYWRAKDALACFSFSSLARIPSIEHFKHTRTMYAVLRLSGNWRNIA
jgi:hypothetical protein